MVKDASKYEADDQKKKSLVESRNKLDNLVHQTKKTVEALGDKLSDEDTTAIDAAVAVAEAGLLCETKSELDEAFTTLNDVMQQIKLFVPRDLIDPGEPC